MDFLILGPIDIRNSSGAVSLGGSKPRALLAVLLLHANEPVSAERLALALWGEDAPGGAVKTIQVHVSRLRKALGDADVVSTTPAGYCLRVRPGELDAERFERLVEHGRRALGEGQPDDAVTILREALALWRGPALAELALEPFAGAEIARLEEQRLSALELRAEADLAAGRHAELVGELQRLVADNPTRERLAAQLMLALYRCGRQTEALETYTATRRVLVDEVGIEPGPHLRELHQAILRQDVTLQAQTPQSELPPELDATAGPPLVGRDDELAWLLARWKRARGGAGGLVALTGPRGIGKRRLMAEFASAIQGRGITLVHVPGEGSADMLRGALRRAAEATRPTLLVIDAADRAGSGIQAELARLAPKLAAAPVLVVACAQDALALALLRAGDTLELAALDAEAVRAIAAHYAPARSVADVPADWLLKASGGVARRVHEVASQWARREAASHVSAVAGRAEAGRAELRTIEAELTGGVLELQGTRDRVPPRGDENAPVVCPFKGLASYEVADASYFFGRERLLSELVARIVGARLLGVVGPSGSGKSSVLRAGLLPALARGDLPGSEGWPQVLIRPGAHPVQELAAGLADVDRNRRVVLAVDQFEETFTVCDDERERSVFISELVRAAQDPDGRYVVLLALRADHYGRCAAYSELASMLAASNVLVRSMQPDELRRAVERPARRAGLRIEPELVDALVADVEQEPGGLPLLSTALLELWQRRDGRRLSHSAYAQTGGVHGAVARLAEDAFAQLDEDQQDVARGVLMRLVGSADGDTIERRRVALHELEIERNEDVARVVALLTDRRLLTVSAGSVELAHEALLREWPRLRGWIDEDHDGLRIQRGLSGAAEEWERLGRDDGALYRGTRLGEALEWRDARRPVLNKLERAFLAASDAALDRERVTRRRRTRLAGAASLTALLAVTAIAVAVVFTKREHAVIGSRDLARRADETVSSDPARALGLSLAALKRRDTEQAESAVRQATLANRMSAITLIPRSDATKPAFAYTVVPSRDGRRLMTASEGGLVHLWSVPGGKVESTIKGHKEAALSASFSPSGDRIATVGADGAVAIAERNGTGRQVLLTLPDKDYGRSVEFSPDGRQLLVATGDGVVGLVATGERPARLRRLGAYGGRAKATFNSAGTKVASSSKDGARIWSVEGGQPIPLAHPPRVAVNATSFSPDGRLVATAADDGIVRIWNASDGGPVRDIPVAGVPVGSVRFSSDGRRIVTGAIDGVVRVSAVGGGPPLNELRGTDGVVNDAAFISGSDQIASVGYDETLRIWSPQKVDQLAAGDDRTPSKQPSFSANGRVVVGYEDGDVRVWNSVTGADTALPRHHGDPTEAMYSGDGRFIVSASLEGPVRLWDVERRQSLPVPSVDAKGEKDAVAIDSTGQRVAIATLDEDTVVQAPNGDHRVVLHARQGNVIALDFSVDGKHVVSGSEDGAVRTWNAANGILERKLDAGGKVLDVAYSRDGKHVAAAGADGTVRIWALSGGTPVRLYGHTGGVNTVAFNPAGDRLVSAGKDGTVRIWDTAGGVALVVLQEYRGDATGAAFTADGKRVVSAGARERALRISLCDLCGTFATVLRQARSQSARTLDTAERRGLSSSGG
jgi:WD40 repeat protein/DNA-binding SARP family transcriptional activator